MKPESITVQRNGGLRADGRGVEGREWREEEATARGDVLDIGATFIRTPKSASSRPGV